MQSDRLPGGGYARPGAPDPGEEGGSQHRQVGGSPWPPIGARPYPLPTHRREPLPGGQTAWAGAWSAWGLCTPFRSQAPLSCPCALHQTLTTGRQEPRLLLCPHAQLQTPI